MKRIHPFLIVVFCVAAAVLVAAIIRMNRPPVPYTGDVRQSEPAPAPDRPQDPRTADPQELIPKPEKSPESDSRTAPDFSLNSMLVGEFEGTRGGDHHRLVFHTDGRFEHYINGRLDESATFAVATDLRMADVGGWDRVEIQDRGRIRYKQIEFERTK